MPSEYRETILRVLRDFEGYSGDGRGGVGELPVGDRSTAQKALSKRDLRDVLLDADNSFEAARAEADRAEAGAARAALYDGPRLKTVALLRADTAMTLTAGQPGTVIRGQTVRVDEGQYTYCIPLAGSGHFSTAGGVPLEYVPADGIADLRAFGVDLSGNVAAWFALAASLVPGGRVLAPIASLNLGTGIVEGNGVTIVGRGDTVVTANALRRASLLDAVHNGVPTESRAIHPPIRIDASAKAIIQFAANERRVYSLSATDGYLLHVLRNNVTTNAADSLAASGSDQTQWRMLAMQKCVEVLLGFRTSSGASGAWAETTFSTGVSAFTSGTYYNYDYSVDAGAWREYTLEVPSSGIVGLSLLSATNGAENVSVSVDGVNVLTGINTRFAARRMDLEFRANPGTRVIRVTNNDATTSRLNIIGVNFASLRDQRPGWQVSHVGHYRNSARIDPLIIPPSSANDYAIWDLDANCWGGSYHGGERDFTDLLLIDGASATLTAGAMRVCRSLEMIQTSTLDWSPRGGTSLEVFTRIVWSQGGYSEAMSFTGEVYGRDFFTFLFGANQAYTQLDTPERKAISDIPAGQHYHLPRGSAVELSAGGIDRLRIDHTHYPDAFSSPSIWRVTGANGYHKFYAPLVKSGGKDCRNVQSVAVVTG